MPYETMSTIQRLTRRQLLAATTAGASAALSIALRHKALPGAEAAPPADPRIRGPFPILTTPFTAKGAVDFAALAAQARFVDWGGCAGMIWPQSGDSVDLLSADEKREGMEVLAQATRGMRTALCLGVQGKDTAEMLAFARHAERLAPAAIISRPPDLGKTESDLREYWRALATVARRPVIIQTSGGTAYRGPAPSVKFLVELAQQFPNFGYVKEEAAPIPARIRQLHAARPPIRCIFSAHGGYGWVYESRLGAAGLITERAVFADVLARIWQLLESGSDPAALQDVYSRFLLVANLAKNLPGGDFRGFQFHLWNKRGVRMTTVSRHYGPKNTIPPAPLFSELKLSKDEITEIDACFDGLKAYLKPGSR